MRKKIAIRNLILLFLALPVFLHAQDTEKPLILQEMSWKDVQEYIKTSDMVIIPLGSTEQHGPHLPLGTDFYEAFEVSKRISAKTGVVVAPVLFVGYSYYHSGFPGTLSLRPETMEQVVFECAEMLMKYGFRRFMLYNFHGGNNTIQDRIIDRINQDTEAVAVAIGVGSPLFKPGTGDAYDMHAGKSETSLMLHFKPELVRLDRLEQPEMRFSPRVEALRKLSEEYPELSLVWGNLLGVPAETGKGGASHELSSNGIWSFSDVKSASAEMGREITERLTDAAVNFINAWKMAEK